MSSLHLRLIDIYGEPLKEPALVRLTGTSGLVLNARIRKGSAKIVVTRADVYRIFVDPLAYHAVSAFANVIFGDKPTPLTLVCALEAEHVTSVLIPTYASLDLELSTILDRSSIDALSGAALYHSLDQLRVASLLNISAKCTATVLPSGRNVLSYVRQINELRQDRFFALVTHALREEVKHSIGADLFREVSGSLHHPPEGYAHGGSFKTQDSYGNLQLTFFTDGTTWLADIDIDDAAGLQHVFHVVEHKVLNRKTHPYDIHQILLQHQQLDTHYRLVASA